MPAEFAAVAAGEGAKQIAASLASGSNAAVLAS
ncbi:NADH-ubiquinone oxidoreductase%2C 75 kDa subunit [Bordetella pertussis]|nr:NADH-ubiquinone oxidoreductase%2C 75 kDa subunit [Bordetella pertussis]